MGLSWWLLVVCVDDGPRTQKANLIRALVFGIMLMNSGHSGINLGKFVTTPNFLMDVRHMSWCVASIQRKVAILTDY